MKTKQEVITELKAEYPTLRTGSDEDGYVDLSAAEYEATITLWADNLLAVQEEALLIAAEQHEAEVAKEAAQAKLAALGLTTDDLKALGLGDN